jgi:hypothetical protein
MKKLLLVICIAFICNFVSFSDDVLVKPAGVYAEINMERETRLVKDFKGRDGEKQQKAISEALENLDSLNPIVMYYLSNLLFDLDNNFASKLFFIAQLRARIDANICADVSAREIVSQLNQNFGYKINTYTIKDKENLIKIVESVLDYVRTHEVSYDRRWVNLFGMGAFINDPNEQLSYPVDEWDKIIKDTIDQYEKDFYEVIQNPEYFN